MQLMNNGNAELLIGEAAHGSDQNRAHINIALGDKSGPMGFVYANSMGRGQLEQTPFTVVVKPGLIARPITLFVNKRPLVNELHAKLTYGPAQMGIAKALVESLRDLDFPPEAQGSWVAVTAVFVADDADDADQVFINNAVATRCAIANALEGRPTFNECLSALGELGNRHYKPSKNMMSMDLSDCTP